MTAQANSNSSAALSSSNEALIEEFRTNGGAVSGTFSGVSLLLLNTTGAKTGKPRTTPVTYARDFSRLTVIAANPDSPTHPDWYHDIVANRVVTVEVGRESFAARATIAEGSERRRLFDRLVAVIPRLAETQRSTSRELPIIVLQRTG